MQFAKDAVQSVATKKESFKPDLAYPNPRTDPLDCIELLVSRPPGSIDAHNVSSRDTVFSHNQLKCEGSLIIYCSS